MCCNTGPGPQLATVGLRDATGIHLTQRLWHSCRCAVEDHIGMKLTNNPAHANEVRRVATEFAQWTGVKDPKLLIEGLRQVKWVESNLYRIEALPVIAPTIPTRTSPMRIEAGGQPVSIEDLTERIGGWAPGDRTQPLFIEGSYLDLHGQGHELFDLLGGRLSKLDNARIRVTPDGKGLAATFERKRKDGVVVYESFAAMKTGRTYSFYRVPHVVASGAGDKRRAYLSKRAGCPTRVLTKVSASDVLAATPRGTIR